jgi:membrane protein YdbS with pleckstrin-like domain
MMQALLFSSASALSFIWFLVHFLVGGKEVARPLLADQHLTDTVRQTLYLCWHLVSASIAAMAVFFALAVWLEAPSYAVSGLLLAVGFVAVGVTIVPLRAWRYRNLPQGWLFVPIVVMGTVALFIS